jgi:hypothetical protein
MAQVRPIHLIGARRLEALRARSESALNEWAKVWASSFQSLSDIDLRVELIDQAGTPETENLALFETSRGRVWFSESQQEIESLGLVVLGECAPRGGLGEDAWAFSCIEKAREARNRALLDAFMGDASSDSRRIATIELPAEVSGFGTGNVLVRSSRLGFTAIVDSRNAHLECSAAGATRPALPAAVPVDRAAHAAPLRLEVHLGDASLSVATLFDIHVGDVLRLSRRLDEDLMVRCGGKDVARGALGKIDALKGIRITTRT